MNNCIVVFWKEL